VRLPIWRSARSTRNAAIRSQPVRASSSATAQQRAIRAPAARERRTASGANSPRLRRRRSAAAEVAQAFVVVEARVAARGLAAEPILVWLGFGYLASFALGVGALYGSIPLVVAWRRRALSEWA
jgi:hypothetical protein